ncbi:hypothetical protein ACFL6I_13665 [candidate division KSB1 bacterium]
MKKSLMQMELIQPDTVPEEKTSDYDISPLPAKETEDNRMEPESLNVVHLSALELNMFIEAKKVITELIMLNESGFVPIKTRKTYGETRDEIVISDGSSDQKETAKPPEKSVPQGMAHAIRVSRIIKDPSLRNRSHSVQSKTHSERKEKNDLPSDVFRRSLKNPNFFTTSYSQSAEPE